MYRQISFYARVTVLKTLCKSKSHTPNKKFPFKIAYEYFLGVRGLTTSYYIVCVFVCIHTHTGGPPYPRFTAARKIFGKLKK